MLLGTAFSTMTALLAVHGLATPGVLAGPNGVVAFAGAASLPAGALVLALSALPALRRPRRIGALLARAGRRSPPRSSRSASARSRSPRSCPAVPQTGDPAAYALLAAGLALLGAARVPRRAHWQLTRRPADLLVVVGVAWLASSLLAQLTVPFTQLGFYLGHVLELGGIVIALGVPAALDLRRGAASRPLVGDLARDRARRAGGGVPRRRACARSSSAWPRRTPRPRATRAASRCSPSRSARRSACRAAGCARSRSAGCCTTWASSPSRARS